VSVKSSDISGKRKASDNSAWEETLLLSDSSFPGIYKSEEFTSNLRQVVLRCFEARSREAIMRLKGFIKAMYTISDERCHAFHPDEKLVNEKTKVVADLEKYSAFKDKLDVELLARALVPTGGSELDEPTAKKIVRTVISDYNRLSVMLDADPEDYTVAVKKTKERKAYTR